MNDETKNNRFGDLRSNLAKTLMIGSFASAAIFGLGLTSTPTAKAGVASKGCSGAKGCSGEKSCSGKKDKKGKGDKDKKGKGDKSCSGAKGCSGSRSDG